LKELYLKVSLVNIITMRGNEADYSDSDEDNNSVSSSEMNTKPKKIINTKPKNNIEAYEDDDSVIESSEEEDDDEPENDIDENESDEGTIGGANSDIEEGEIEEGEIEGDTDDDGEISENDDIELDEYGEPIEKKTVTKSSKTQKPKKNQPLIVEDDDEEEDDYDENYLQKFDSEITKNYITEFHPECLNHNYEEIAKLSMVVRNSDNIIIDPLHRTIPFLTKYEKARILGQRAKQIETGSKPFIKIPENIVDSYIIAELELRDKKIPFIIKRPIPNGGFEYWHLKDLEIIGF
jgi:DNA-directed RNA polymerase I, II, and III subunit RPABC2